MSPSTSPATLTRSPLSEAGLELAPGVILDPAAWTDAARRVLTPEAVALLARLHREMNRERLDLLRQRDLRQRSFDAGERPGFLDGPVSEAARGEWQIAPLPADLRVRRVEITGPVSDPKMVINMLSRNDAGQRADCAMLDFEDSMKPAWANVMAGVENLIGAADGSLSFVRPAAGGEAEKVYRLNPDDMPVLMVRCRGLHLAESNLTVDGEPISGGLLDLAVSVFHTAAKLVLRGKTPKYYVPKVEHHLEARFWNRLFEHLEAALGLPKSTLRATFLIETLPAAFQVEEILYELRDHAAGLNVGRWDKIFSDIKVLREHRDRILADRASISMNRPWMKDYALHLIRICHRHGAFAMGGMAAFTPGRTLELRAEQTAKVVADKRFEAAMGHDGCWVSHPYFIGPALSAFERPNQLDVLPEISPRPSLLPQGGGPRTMEGLRKNIRVGIAYMESWRRGIGCVAWDDLMEDLATLEISRAQTWQWLHHRVHLDDGPEVSRQLVERIFDEELDRIAAEIRASAHPEAPEIIESFLAAAADAREIFTETEFRPFLASASDRVSPTD